jgi:hypothetical protein
MEVVVGLGRMLFVGCVGASVPWRLKACGDYGVGFDMVMHDSMQVVGMAIDEVLEGDSTDASQVGNGLDMVV